MRLICVRTKAEYFSIPGLTRFLKIRSDLPVVPVGRTRHKIALARKANQSAVGRVGKAHLAARSVMDDGHAAIAPCPPYETCVWFVARMSVSDMRDRSPGSLRSPGLRHYHASIHGRFFVVRASGFGTERRPDMIQCRVSAGSITSSISSTEAIETALPLA
jgi:hypothetical protein